MEYSHLNITYLLIDIRTQMEERSVDLSNKIKYTHLVKENTSIMLEMEELRLRLKSQQEVIQLLIKGKEGLNDEIVMSLIEENRQLQTQCTRLAKLNQQLSCDLLMKDQLICQINNQYAQISSNYQEKMAELMQSLAKKEQTIIKMELKLFKEGQCKIGSSSRSNLLYFSHVEEFKRLLARTIIQNAQLKLILSKKQEQISNITKAVSCAQDLLRKNEHWQSFKKNHTVSTEDTDPKPNDKRLNLQELIANYEKDFKGMADLKISASKQKDIKLLMNQLNYENAVLNSQKTRCEKYIKNMTKEHKMLTAAYRGLENECFQLKIEADFYKNYFKELTKVTTERKVMYYMNQYEEIVPHLHRIVNYRELVANYFKKWQKNRGNMERKMISRHSKQIRTRNYSCMAKLGYFKPETRKKIEDHRKQTAIVSFLVNSGPEDTLLKGCLLNNHNRQKKNMFQDDLSMIQPPKRIAINDYEALNEIILDE